MRRLQNALVLTPIALNQPMLSHFGLRSLAAGVGVSCAAISGLLCLAHPHASHAQTAIPVPITIQQQGDTRVATMTLPITPKRAWAVLTDYVATGEAMPDITKVQVLKRSGSSLQLRQTYQAPYTFGLAISAELAVEEEPERAIRFRLLRGDLIRSLHGHWILTPVQGGTRLSHTITLKPELPTVLQQAFRQLTQSSLRQSMLLLQQRMLKP